MYTYICRYIRIPEVDARACARHGSVYMTLRVCGFTYDATHILTMGHVSQYVMSHMSYTVICRVT